ncbi:ABC transporter substrate-binding protein [Sandaracinobacteroides saxicola]|uniref:Sugar ABC transporter substrate-binding protein n=1 Tax=Sandaracinobacteroides saxicola TaxID=2759707 RepID=A0A7G5IM45_9SPHN|nr:sugar ABC transporter substrate-binding protein [Sandaracinobacteroides saxicola]QMW24437.1 sugar ABC transporter substrate-binding protein [Sandaracinobacteroides saxicola]
MAGCTLTKALALLLALLTLSACDRAETNGKVVVTVWTEYSAAPQKPVFEAIVAEFNRTHPGIEVRHTGFENTPYETTLKTAFAGGKPPDIVEMNGGANAFQYARAGLLADLTDFVAPIRPRIAAGMEPAFDYRGRAYGIPWQLSIGNLLWYNPAMLRARGIDPNRLATWNGFLSAAERFKAQGLAPIAFGNREGWPGNHLFTHFSRRLMTTAQYTAIATRTFDPTVTSDFGWDDPVPVRAWALYRDLRDRGLFTAGYLSDDTPAASSLFLNGKVPFYFMGSWFIGDVEVQGGTTPIDVTMFPTVDGAPGKSGDLVTNTLVFTLTKASKQPEAAKLFLAYLTTEPVQRKWAEGVQGLVPYRYDTRGWSLKPLLRKVAALYASATSAAPFLDMLEDQSCNVPGIWDGSVAVLTGQLSPQEAGAMHEKCVKQLERANGWR